MKITITDGYTANPGDLSWNEWESISDNSGNKCEFHVYDRTAPEEVTGRVADAEIVLTNKVIFSKEVLEALPKLKYIGVLATGYNVVDIAEAKRRGITVTNIPAYSTTSVAQLAIAHLLHITNNVAGHSDSVKEGAWTACQDFTYTLSPQRELAGQTFAVIGLGNTGMATAIIAHALGMRILAFTSKAKEQLPDFIEKARDMEEIFMRADVLSLHCPLTEDTHHIVNEKTLAMMRPEAIIINTGRGPLIDEDALANALRENRIYAAGIDVLATEPPREGSPLIEAPRCYITPHIAWATKAARKRLLQTALDNVKAFIAGNPTNAIV